MIFERPEEKMVKKLFWEVTGCERQKFNKLFWSLNSFYIHLAIHSRCPRCEARLGKSKCSGKETDG